MQGTLHPNVPDPLGSLNWDRAAPAAACTPVSEGEETWEVR